MQPTYMGKVGPGASQQTGIPEGSVVLFYLHPEDPNIAMNIRIWTKGEVEAVGINHVAVGPGKIEMVCEFEIQSKGERAI